MEEFDPAINPQNNVEAQMFSQPSKELQKTSPELEQLSGILSDLDTRLKTL